MPHPSCPSAHEPIGVITNAKKAKVAIFTCPLDVAQTETKGTVLIHNANEMLDFTKGEEKHMEQMLKGIADAGVKVVVTGNNVGELALHYLNRFGIMVVKVLSKFDLRRLCRVTGATALARVGAPMAEEMGFCDIVESVEIGGDRVTVFRQEEEISKTATIVVRGATLNHLDDVERALDDGINVIKALVKDPRLVPGAGACEMELLKRLLAVGEVLARLFAYVLFVVTIECWESFMLTNSCLCYFGSCRKLPVLISTRSRSLQRLSRSSPALWLRMQEWTLLRFFQSCTPLTTPMTVE